MKRFWKEVAVEAVDGEFRVTLDGRAIRTQGGGAQVVPTLALAEALAEEWRGQGEDVDPARFVMRDMADFAIDQIRPDRAATFTELLGYAETDTLCYRADPEDHLYRRQLELWEPILTTAEARWDVHFTRVSGILHRPQPEATMARLRSVLEGLDEFSLAALRTMTPIAASLTVALAALEDGADTEKLFAAANCEQDWQAELWGWDLEAENARARRLGAFEAAVNFARLARA